MTRAVVRTPLATHLHARGMVLIVVLWMVAALAILVTGMSRTVRDDARIVSLARQSALAQGLGDAALALVLQQMAALPTPPASLSVVEVAYRGSPIAVEVVPLNGLIDLNNAAPALLAALYRTAGGAAPAQAQALAAATDDWRSQKDERGLVSGFEAVEDLLRVPGLGYDLYARIAPLVTTEISGGGRVNPLAAPFEVLLVLANGDAALAQTIAARRAAGEVGIDTTRLEAAFIDSGSGRRFRLRARVPMADGGWILVGCTVNLRASTRTGLPWTLFRKFRQVESAARAGV